MNKPARIASGAAGVLVGMALVMPAVALARKSGALPAFEIVLLLLGLALTAGGGWLAVKGATSRPA